MFLLLEVPSLTLILGVVPEPFEVLFFGVALVFLTVGLRWLMKRGERDADAEIQHTTKEV